MKPILFEKSETTFTSLGLGILNDCLSCRVTEQLNGKYECEFTYPITGSLYSLILPDRIVKVKANDISALQLFRIYRISKPLNGVVTVYCQHISYDLNMVCVLAYPKTTGNATTILNDLSGSTLTQHNFTFTSDFSGNRTVPKTPPQSLRKWLGNSEGCILNVFSGGEFEFDNFTVKFWAQRGSDTDICIAYGKNLTDLNADIDIQNVYTSIYPYAIDSDGVYHYLSSGYVELEGASSYAEARTLPLDVSNFFKDGESYTDAKLREYATTYAAQHKINQINQNLKISFVPLWQTKEYEQYAALERVKMGDRVTVEYAKLGVNSKLEVIGTVYNTLEERYESIELGTPKATLSQTLSGLNSKIVEVQVNEKSAIRQAVDHATELITGGLGGYVIIEPNESTGYPEEILIMDTASKTTATNVIRINKNGIGFSTTGYSGTYTTAWTIDGHFVADFITTGNLNASLLTTGTLNADLIKAGTLQDTSGTTSINMSTGKITINQENGGKVDINSSGLFLYNADNSNIPVRIFLAQNGIHGAIDTETLYVGTDTIIADNFFQLNGSNYYPRQITVNGTVYTVLAQ